VSEKGAKMQEYLLYFKFEQHIPGVKDPQSAENAFIQRPPKQPAVKSKRTDQRAGFPPAKAESCGTALWISTKSTGI